MVKNLCLLLSALATAVAFSEPAPLPLFGPVGELDIPRLLEDRDRFWTDTLTLYHQGQLSEAIGAADKVLATERKLFGVASEQSADTMRWLARLHMESGEFAAARQAFAAVLAIEEKRFGKGNWQVTTARLDLARAQCLQEVGLARWRQRQQEWQQHFEAATQSKRKGQGAPTEVAVQKMLAIDRELFAVADLRRVAADLEWLGRLQAERSDFPLARKSWEEVAAIHTRLFGKDSWQATDARLMLDYLERCQHLQGQARRRFAEAWPGDGSVKRLVRAGRLEDTIQRGEATVKICRELPTVDPLLLARSLNSLGCLYRVAGDHGHAQPLLQEALARVEKVPCSEHPLHGQILKNLGLLWEDRGERAQARKWLEQALELQRRVLGEQDREYGLTLNELAMFYLDAGDMARAEPYVRPAFELWRNVLADREPDPDALVQYAISLNDLGMQFLVAGTSGTGAEHCFREAARIVQANRGEEHFMYGMARHNLGLLYQDRGDFTQARAELVRAEAVLKKSLGPEHARYARCLSSLAAVYQATGDADQALALQVRAMRIEQVNLRRAFSFCAEPAMRAHLGAISSSLDLLISMVLEQPPPDPAAVKTALTWTLRRKAVILDTLCRFREARGLMEQDPQVKRKVEQVRDLRLQLAKLPLHPRAGLDEATLRASADRLEGELNQLFFQRRPDLFGDLDTADTDAVQRHLPQGAALVEVVRIHLYDFKAVRPAPRWQPPHYVAFVLTGRPGSSPSLIDLGDARDVDENVKQVREQVRDAAADMKAARTMDELAQKERTQEEVFRTVSKKLYQRLCGPESRSILKQTLRIYVAPDGQLNGVPFEALVADDDQYLIEKGYAFSYLSSGRDLLRPAGKPGHGTVVIAGPDFELSAAQRAARADELLGHSSRQGAPVIPSPLVVDPHPRPFEPLREAAAEAGDIEKALGHGSYGPVQSYVGADALEEVFKRVSCPRILHVATHAFFLEYEKPDPEARLRPMCFGARFPATCGQVRLREMENPLLRSGLALAGANMLGENGVEADRHDGWVTAEEIALLNLQGTELVVISACASGQGDVLNGEGVAGMRWAFFYAGARTLLTSLFDEVPSTETRHLMKLFYEALAAGKGKREALHLAQVKVLAERRHAHGAAHPYFWANFVLVGNLD